MMTGRAWFLGSDLAGVATAMITHKGRARAPTRPSPARHPPGHAPEDFADPLRLILPGQTTKVLQICDAEPNWLDWVLAHLGVKGEVNALLTQPPQAPKSRLWVP
jgi:hypothetical protein